MEHLKQLPSASVCFFAFPYFFFDWLKTFALVLQLRRLLFNMSVGAGQYNCGVRLIWEALIGRGRYYVFFGSPAGCDKVCVNLKGWVVDFLYYISGGEEWGGG